MAKQLIDLKYDVNARYVINGKPGISLLEVTINKKDFEGFSLLLNNGANPDYLPKDSMNSLNNTLNSLISSSILNCTKLGISKNSSSEETRNELRQIMKGSLLKNRKFCEAILFDNDLPYNSKKIPSLDQLALYVTTHLLETKRELKGFFRNHTLTTIHLTQTREIPQDIIDRIFDQSQSAPTSMWTTPET